MRPIACPNQSTNSFGYYGTGQRAWKVDSAGTSRFVYDGDEYGAPILAEVGGGRDYIATYTHGVNGLISQRRASATNWYAFDDLGSTRNLTNSSQTITDAYTYKAFGEIPASSGSTTNPFRYIGSLNYYKDADSSLLMLGARYYAPQWGRFTTVDPAGEGDNLYVYVASAVTTEIDPSGLQAMCFVGRLYCNGTVTMFNPATGALRWGLAGSVLPVDTCSPWCPPANRTFVGRFFGPAFPFTRGPLWYTGPGIGLLTIKIPLKPPYGSPTTYTWQIVFGVPQGTWILMLTARCRFVGNKYRCNPITIQPPTPPSPGGGGGGVAV